MSDKVVLITGANSGTGRCTAIKLASKGMKVAVVGRRYERNQAVVGEICKAGGTAVGITGDVSDAKQCDNIVANTLDTFGKIDVLINNAGISQWESFLEMTNEGFEQIMRTNLFGAVYLTKACYPQMLKQDYGHIINVASVAAFWPEKNEFAYGISKMALVKFSMHLWIEFRENANRNGNNFFVHCLLPAGMNTAFWGEEKERDPDKLAPELFAELPHVIIEHPDKGLPFFEEYFKDTRLHLHIFEQLGAFPFLNPNLICVGLKSE